MTIAQHHRLHFKNVQSGVVLFLAMIALVVMSLAAVALIRSVDTNSMIAGNLSYKQTAAISSSYGIEAMANTIGEKPLTYGDADDAVNGYYATCKSFGTGTTDADKCNGANLTLDASWDAGNKSAFATGDGITPGTGKDMYGNTIQYIVERMCYADGPPNSTACLQAAVDLDNNTKIVLNEPSAGAPEQATDLPIYRVTVRVTGPKNTISFIQAFIS